MKKIKQKSLIVVRCIDCIYWDMTGEPWYSNRPCMCEEGFFVGGGDNNDGLYTEPTFGCVKGKLRREQ